MTTFFIMFLAFSHSTVINTLNTTPPKMLNQFPYNLRVCLLHGFVPVSASFILAAILFAQSKALRRTFLVFSSRLFSRYRISVISFRGNYSFLNLTLCTVTFGNSTYRCGNYSREEIIQGRKLYEEIRYLNCHFCIKSLE